MSLRATLLPESALFTEATLTDNAKLRLDTPGRMYIEFANSGSQKCTWAFVAPLGLTTPLLAVIHYRFVAGTTGTAAFNVLLEAITAGDAFNTAALSSFAAANTIGGQTVPATAGDIGTYTVTLTNNDSIAPGDLCRLKIERDTVTDTANGVLQVLAVEFRDAV